MIFLSYLGKMVLCSGILLGYYWLFLRNRRFHHYNRFYLLTALLLPVIVPLISFPVASTPQKQAYQALYQVAKAITLPGPAIPAEQAGAMLLPDTAAPRPSAWSFLNPGTCLWAIYFAGTGYLLWLFGRSLYAIHRLRRKYPVQRLQGVRFYNTREPGTPFSFFRSVFWDSRIDPASQQGQRVLRHELFHVQQGHSADIVLAELVIIFAWFNPFFRLLKKELKTIHEFQADQHAVSDSDPIDYARLLVLHSAQTNKLALPHYFSYHPIKRRITMITQHNQTRYSYWSRLMVLPLALTVSCLLTLKAQEAKPATPTTALTVYKPTDVRTDLLVNTTSTKPSTYRATAARPARQATQVHTATPAAITPEKVRLLLQTVFTMPQAAELFGTPTEKMLSPQSGIWVYPDRDSQLRIDFEPATDSIKSFSYTLRTGQTAALTSYEAVRQLKEGATTNETIANQFGTPTYITIVPRREIWEYRHDKSNLSVEFGRQGLRQVVEHFVYTERK